MSDSIRNHQVTPGPCFEWADDRWGPFDLDVAAAPDNAKVEQHYTEADNGLAKPWFGRVWCNPPWSNIEPWIKKALIEVGSGRCELACFLLPTRTGRRWWLMYAGFFHIHPIRGRIKFGARAGTKQGGGGFEDCAYFVLELPPEARDLNG